MSVEVGSSVTLLLQIYIGICVPKIIRLEDSLMKLLRKLKATERSP